MRAEGLVVPDKTEPVALTDDQPGAPGVSLERFVAEHGLALTRFAYLVSGDRGRAEDIVQEAYLGLYRRWGGMLPPDLPAAYARKAIVRAQLSHNRRRWTTERPAAELPEVGSIDADAAEADGLWQLLTGLSHRQRCVLVLRYRYGCADDEIAETLGCRRATVRSLAARALAELRGSVTAAGLIDLEGNR